MRVLKNTVQATESSPTTSFKTDNQPESASNAIPLRVLFVSHTYVVGVNQGKLAAIAQQPFTTVGLLAPKQWLATSWNQLFELEQEQPHIAYQPAGVVLNGRSGGYLYQLSAILKALKTFCPNIIQVEEEVFSLSTFQMAIVSRLTGIPMSVFGWENLDQKLSLPRQWCRKFVLKTARMIVAGNQDGADLLRLWGYRGKITVMPQMGVDPDLFPPAERRLPTDRAVRIGFMGRLVPEKGIDLIFQAAEQLKTKGHSLEVVLCGSGTEESSLKQLVEEKDLVSQVIWRGKVAHSQVPDELSKFDILVLPSRTTATWKEQFGHVLIESMSMGIPVVGSSSGEIPNVIGDESLVFSENDAAALARVLERLISDAESYKNASRYGIDRVNSTYTHDRIAKQLIEEWRSVVTTSVGQ